MGDRCQQRGFEFVGLCQNRRPPGFLGQASAFQRQDRLVGKAGQQPHVVIAEPCSAWLPGNLEHADHAVHGRNRDIERTASPSHHGHRSGTPRAIRQADAIKSDPLSRGAPMLHRPGGHGEFLAVEDGRDRRRKACPHMEFACFRQQDATLRNPVDLDDPLDNRRQDVVEGDVPDQGSVEFVEQRGSLLLANGNFGSRSHMRHQLTGNDRDTEIDKQREDMFTPRYRECV